MKLWEIFITALALSADAFAVSLCKGLSVRKIRIKHSLITGLYFGVFQAVMTCLGFSLGNQFKYLIVKLSPIAAFIMLSLIGINMLLEAKRKAEAMSSSFKLSAMLPLAIATSIDALATGTSLALISGTNITVSSIVIGVTAFFLSAIGIYVGNLFGAKLKSKAEALGGIILILMGLKIFFEFALFKS